jgi:hypothetical protein
VQSTPTSIASHQAWPSQIATATTDSTRRSRQREIDNLERDLIRAEGRVLDQDKAIAALQRKIDREQETEQKKRDQAEAKRQQERARRDRAVDRDLGSASYFDLKNPDSG